MLRFLNDKQSLERFSCSILHQIVFYHIKTQFCQAKNEVQLENVTLMTLPNDSCYVSIHRRRDAYSAILLGETHLLQEKAVSHRMRNSCIIFDAGHPDTKVNMRDASICLRKCQNERIKEDQDNQPESCDIRKRIGKVGP